MATTQQIIEQSEFYSQLSEKVKIKFLSRIENQLRKSRKINSSDAQSKLIDTLEITEENGKRIHAIVNNTLSFSWLAFLFSLFWAAYHKAPLAYVIVLAVFVPSWVLLFINYGGYLVFNDIVTKAGIGISVVYGMFGRSWIIGNEFAMIATEKYGIQMTPFPKWSYIGTGFSNPWIRVLVLFIFLTCLVAIEAVLVGYAGSDVPVTAST